MEFYSSGLISLRPLCWLPKVSLNYESCKAAMRCGSDIHEQLEVSSNAKDFNTRIITRQRLVNEVEFSFSAV